MRERIIVLATVLALLGSQLLTLTVGAEVTQQDNSHYHGNVNYEPWDGGEGHNRLPQQGGCYYLTSDIVCDTKALAVTLAAGRIQHLCLNGHTVTHCNTSGRLYEIKGDYYLEDCSAHTDDRGDYISGGITYGGKTPNTRSYGALFSVQRGGSMTITAGQIYGLESTGLAGAAVYVQGANTTARAVFTMLDGQIHSNKAQAICMSKSTAKPATENFSQVKICGGRIWGNRCAISVTGDVLNITGGTITKNGDAGPAVSVGAEAQVCLSGQPDITENPGGNLYLSGDVTVRLGQLGTGTRVGIGAEKTGRAISTSLEGIPEGCFQSDDPQQGITVRENRLYLGYFHEHALEDGGKIHWRKWTGRDCLPSVSGNYYLEYDVKLTSTAVLNDGVQLNLCLNGHSVTAPEGKRIMTVGSGCQLHITDCCQDWGRLTGGSSDYGAGVFVMHGGSLTLYRGMITHNNAREAGGAVYVQGSREDDPGGRFQMYGGQLLENTADRGGGIYGEENSSILLAGGAVTQNQGGGVYVSSEATSLQVQGGPVVEDNAGGDLCLQGQVCITAGQLEPEARLFVSCQEGNRAITDGSVDAVTAGCFFSDSPYWVIRYEDKLYWDMTLEHTHCLCAADAKGCTHQAIPWQAWESATALPEASGYYYLTQDVQLTKRSAILPGQQITLCLNGHRVTAAEGDRLFQVHNQAQLVIADCVGSGQLTGGSHGLGGAINIMRGGRADLYGGAITGNTGKDYGSAVYVQAEKPDSDGGMFNMYGGCISENNGYRGAVYAQGAGAKVNLYGGSFLNNTAQDSGGAIYAGKQSQLMICDVLFRGNRAGGKGAGIYQAEGSKLTIKDSQLLENVGADTGSAIYAGGELVLDGCLITGNQTQNGTAVHVTSIKAGQRKLGGDLQIHSNQGTMDADLYFSRGVVATGTQEGFGKNTRIRIQLYSGLVTDAVLAAYDYEGGNRVYTITYGNRSLTDREKEPEERKQTAKESSAAATALPEKEATPSQTQPTEKAPVDQDNRLPGKAPVKERIRRGIWGLAVLLLGSVGTVFLLRRHKNCTC